MVKIRLRRMGAKKNPYYRIVVADSHFPRDGRFIEEIGTYNPLATPSEINIDMERAKYWIANGAQPTDTVKALLKKAEAEGENNPMKELLTYIIQNLVDHPDEVSVTEREAGNETVFEVRVADGDMGKVIGRQGRIIKEVRILKKAVAQRKGKKVSVEVID